MSAPVALHELVQRLSVIDIEHVRTERCACGGFITADERRPFHQMNAHVRGVEHQLWWRRVEREWVGEP